MTTMAGDFILYIPTHNDSQAAIESVHSAPEWQIVVVDNGSAPVHREAIASLASPRVKVVMHDPNIGRVQNWQWCVNDFMQSGSIWFKMLAAGDKLKPGALERFRYYISTASGMKLFVPGVEHIGEGNESGFWYWSNKPAVYQPADALRFAAARGNIWHSLSAAFISRYALEHGYTLGDGSLTFCADMLFMAGLARRAPSYFVREPLIERHVRHRKTYASDADSLNATLEESLVRLRCAQYATAYDGDHDALERLTEQINHWTLKRCTENLKPVSATC